VYLLTDGRFAEAAAQSAPWALAVIRQESLSKVVARLVKKHRIRRLGFQPLSVSVGLQGELRKAIRPARLVALPPVVTNQRLIKDETEILAIQKAVRVAESAFRATLRQFRIGMTERQLAALLQYEMIQRGAAEASFPIIVAEGANSSLPHAKPGNRKIRRGSAVLIDWGATVDHYRSDLTRVIFVRRIPPRFKRMYKNVLEAQKEAIQAISPGIRMCDVDARARRVLKEAGMDERFTHGLGHGLGLDIHEEPRLAKRVTNVLQAGMVLTVEPGVYFPGIGGVRIEDDVMVTDKGCRILSRLSRDLEAAVV